MAQHFSLSDKGYFRNEGVDVMAFDDIYPEGHQGGVCLIMHGNRIATNGDLRLEPTPGQWQPVPKQLGRTVEGQAITASLCFPDSSRHMTGFNPMIYPDLQMRYNVRVEPKGDGILVTVDLDEALPQAFVGKVGFNLELFPGLLFGKPWLMDDQAGIFPQQPNSPLSLRQPNHLLASEYRPEGRPVADLDRLVGKDYSPMVADDIVALPYCEGRSFTACPDDSLLCFTVVSQTGKMSLYDGRMNHNNGWFVLREEIAANTSKGAISWLITPHVVKGWMREPVVQLSQVGYHPLQQKKVVIELDANDNSHHPAQLMKITAHGRQKVAELPTNEWGRFLRYRYLQADFSGVKEQGLYQIAFGESLSAVFRIGEDVYQRGVWQPVVEYFLPVQMCHMRVNEKYRVWHDACHMDDALMAPTGNHIDGYAQQPGISSYQALEQVPNVNVGGWHDAGDYDLRVESQAGESFILSLAYETFRPHLDVTAIDQHSHIAEIHQPDGRNDLLQQIENGALSVVASYKALGRLYRGIICPTVRQYVLLGDAAAMTDGQKGNEDDRWIFTENNPQREMGTAAQLAAIARSMKGYNDTLSTACLEIARTIFEKNDERRIIGTKIHAAVELYLSTQQKTYLDYLVQQTDYITSHLAELGWIVARLDKTLRASGNRKAADLAQAVERAMPVLAAEIEKQTKETPYGVPYRPQIWGAGWDIQNFAFRYYFLAKAYPQVFPMAPVWNALNFVLGCHPGTNTESFASGVGASSATVAYGANRADWSYIPGGVVSGTALIRPDFPELLRFPFLWQQTEYCLGGASSHYMFLALAAAYEW
jgi:hypothetical protein